MLSRFVAQSRQVLVVVLEGVLCGITECLKLVLNNPLFISNTLAL